MAAQRFESDLREKKKNRTEKMATAGAHVNTVANKQLDGSRLPTPMEIDFGWQLKDARIVEQSGECISMPGFNQNAWINATVPGTVLSSLVNAGIYQEPLYGENNRPDKIPEDLCRTTWWYRTTFNVPESYSEKRIWLHFDGINYAASTWVNGHFLGSMKGAFVCGVYEISEYVNAGDDAAIAVLVSPQPNPGDPIEHTLLNGLGKNGGETAIDGPTFLCSIGWDWIPGIRDRNTGLWRKVYLSASGDATIKDPQVVTDIQLPRLDEASIAVRSTLANHSSHQVEGVLKGSIENISFSKQVNLPPFSSSIVSFDQEDFPQLKIKAPRLWWPNGYGEQNLYELKLHFEIEKKVSDEKNVQFGIRKITYEDPSSENLTISVNGTKIFAKGGNWGMDEAMKRIPFERLAAQLRMHQLARYTIVRNWVGQSTNDDFYALCDQYGLLVWDEFFQPNPCDGPNPTDIKTYLSNVKDKILRFRNHPSIALWCARNEGHPPKELDDALGEIVAELDPARHYQSSSTDGRGVNSGGPYFWRRPCEYYEFPEWEAFKTEIGSVSIPTLESVQGMMPKKDWDSINDDWAEHDLGRGAQAGDRYPQQLAERYGSPQNLADFIRKGQMMNYESFRAMYEGRQAKLFNPVTGVITWMSHPAQPSFVWQLYHYDLEPNSALFAVRSACEEMHIQLNEKTSEIQVVNASSKRLKNARATISVYGFDGAMASSTDLDVNVEPFTTQGLGGLSIPENTVSAIHFVRLILRGQEGEIVSKNFYWKGATSAPDKLSGLEKLPKTKLEVNAFCSECVECGRQSNQYGRIFLNISIRNCGSVPALMTHLQLRRGISRERVLPVFYTNNYMSLAPDEEISTVVEASFTDLKGEKPLLLVDGWNVTVDRNSFECCDVEMNKNANPENSAVTGFNFDYRNYLEKAQINCGGRQVGPFENDSNRSFNLAQHVECSVDLSGIQEPAPPEVYQSARWDDFREINYVFPMKQPKNDRGYLVRLHFAELTYEEAGKRKFNVDVNGERVLTDFDIFAVAGAKNRAVVKTLPNMHPDENGVINIILRKGLLDTPMINAIEILPQEH